MVYQVQDQSDFLAQLKNANGKLVMVDFYATWCGPCKMVAPAIDAMSKEFTDVVFVKVDVDECEELAADYNIKAMPTFVFLKDGAKVAEFAGANANALRELVLKHK